MEGTSSLKVLSSPPSILPNPPDTHHSPPAVIEYKWRKFAKVRIYTNTVIYLSYMILFTVYAIILRLVGREAWGKGREGKGREGKGRVVVCPYLSSCLPSRILPLPSQSRPGPSPDCVPSHCQAS